MINRIDPNAVTKVVSVSDDAIDLEKMTKEQSQEYAETADISKLLFKEGKKPTYFLVKNVGARRQAEIKRKHYRIAAPTVDKAGNKLPAKIDIIDQTDMLIEYFETCVKQVEEDGKISDISMDEVNFLTVQEIGGYAMLLATIGDALKKN